MYKHLRSFTVPILSKIVIITNFNGPEISFYHSNTQKYNNEFLVIPMIIVDKVAL